VISQQSRSKIILFRVLFALALGLGVCYLFLLLSSTSAMPPQNTHPQAPASSRVTFTKGTSNLTPLVGEVFTFTLDFSTTETETLPIRIRMTDPNPDDSYLEILPDTITGAVYSPTIDGPELVTELLPFGENPQHVTFQVLVTDIPPGPLPYGYPITNKATIADTVTPGSLPETTAEITIRIMSGKKWYFLPFIAKNYSD
jgi:hypothetical protein